jgi:ABC-type uncharacterized transport system auxiliary subunit
MNRIRSAAAIGLLSILLSGCFAGSSTEHRYYLLDYVPEASKARLAQGPWKATVLVRNFEMGEAYHRPELVYRTSAHEMRYRWRDRWALRPEHVVSDMVRKHLVQIRLFETVQNQYDEYQPTHELRGRVVALEEYVTESNRFAHLDMRLDFVRLADNRVLWGQDIDVRQEVKGEDPVLVVRALSALLEASMDRAVAGIDSAMAHEAGR